MNSRSGQTRTDLDLPSWQQGHKTLSLRNRLNILIELARVHIFNPEVIKKERRFHSSAPFISYAAYRMLIKNGTDNGSFVRDQFLMFYSGTTDCLIRLKSVIGRFNFQTCNKVVSGLVNNFIRLHQFEKLQTEAEQLRECSQYDDHLDHLPSGACRNCTISNIWYSCGVHLLDPAIFQLWHRTPPVQKPVADRQRACRSRPLRLI
jgi:hypothetical protein